MRYAKRRDNNHTEIVSALRKAGFEVIDFGSVGHDIPDLLAVKPIAPDFEWACWVEVKSDKGRLSEGQQRFRAIFEPRGEWYEARDPADAVIALRAMYVAAGNAGSPRLPLAPKTPSPYRDEFPAIPDL